MQEKELLKQLKGLKEIKPSHDWQMKNRQLLFNQISASSAYESDTDENWFFVVSKRLAFSFNNNRLQPVLIVAMILLFLGGGGFASAFFSKSAKPGDSLYIAKIINEKTQLALTFDEKEKAKLGIEFATNRADEISRVLAETSDGTKDAKVEQLVNDFRKEIDSVRYRLEKISPSETKTAVAKKTDNQTTTSTNETGDNSSSVFSANLDKDNSGIELSEGAAKNIVPEKSSTTPTLNSNSVSSTPAASSTSTVNTQTILDQAKDLLNEDNYNATLNKLDEASQVIGQVNETGQVKGVEESATTTIEKK